jgi:hypothetical protein
MGEATKNGRSPEGLPNAISRQTSKMAIWETIKKQQIYREITKSGPQNRLSQEQISYRKEF